MATMTLKNGPDDLHMRLKDAAARHRRSLNKEAILCLEQALEGRPPDPSALLAGLRRARAHAHATGVSVTEADLRAARNEDRA